MTVAIERAPPDGAGSVPAADARMAGDLEVPRPLRLFLMFTEPAGAFLMLSTVATIALVVAGTGASTLWFLSVLRKLGLRVRFA